MGSPDRLVVFVLDEQRYALHLAAVERVAPMVHVTPLPKAPDIVSGIIDVGGRIVPVIDMRRRFRLPPRREGALSDQILIAHARRRPVALVADAVTGVLECPEDTLVEAEAVVPNVGFVDGIARLADGLLLIHDLDGFLSLEEEETLNHALASP